MLKQRIITALVLLPVVLVGLFVLNAQNFAWFVALVTGIGAWEWARMAGAENQIFRFGYAALVVLVLFVVPTEQAMPVLYVACVWWLAATALVLTYPRSAELWKASWMR